MRLNISTVESEKEKNTKFAQENNISEEERVKLVESSHEIVTYLPNNLITEKICRIVVDDYPEVIDKRGSLPSDIIKQAFEHGYKVNEKSSTSAISYAIQNNKPIPAEIWNEKNFEKLFKSIETVIYEAHLEKLNILLLIIDIILLIFISTV